MPTKEDDETNSIQTFQTIEVNITLPVQNSCQIKYKFYQLLVLFMQLFIFK